MNNYDDIIDSRDVIARIGELESDAEAFVADGGLDDADKEEMKTLKALADEASGSPDWAYGEALIKRSHFVQYAQDLAGDLGLDHKADQWPANCIDWDYAAEQLEQDYFEVDFDGEEYLIRS